jgi:uncharacterized membrane protein
MRYDDDTHELRIASLERRMAAVEGALLRVSSASATPAPPAAQAARPVPPPVPPTPVVPPSSVPAPLSPASVSPRVPPRPAAAATPVPPRPPRQRPALDLDLEKLLGGKLFAWIGGIAILVGVLFFVATAMERGWIPTGVRVAAAFAGSSILLGVGLWLHERRGQTQASLVAVGTAVAALYASLVAGTSLYHLIPTPLALAVAVLIGATATAAAVRLESVQIAAIGIVGALLAPVLVGAGPTNASLLFMAIALTSSTAVLVWQRWNWLALMAYLVSAPQLARWALDDPGAHAVAGVIVLVGFWAIYVVAALGYELRVPTARLRASSAMLAVSNVLFTTGLGWVMLDRAGHGDGATAWVIGMAALHVAVGALAARRMADGREIPLLFLACGVSLSAIGLALALDGPWLVAGWAVEGALLAYVSNRLESLRAFAASLAFLALAGAIALTIAIPSEGYATAKDAVHRISALLIVAVAALVSGRLLREGPEHPRLGAERREYEAALQLGSAGYALLALPIALDGAWLVASLAAGSVALLWLAVRLVHPVAALCAGMWGAVALALALHLAIPDHGYATSTDAAQRIGALLAVAGAAGATALLLRRNPWAPQATAGLELLAAALVLLALPIALDGVWLVAALCAGAVALAAVAGRTDHLPAALAAGGWGAVGLGHALALGIPEHGYATTLDASTRIPALLVPAAAALAGAFLLRRNRWVPALTEGLETLAAALVLLALPIALDGPALVAALACGAVALAVVARRLERPSCWIAAGAWSAVAFAHVLVHEATPVDALGHGVALSHAVALALAAGSLAGVLLLRASVAGGQERGAAAVGAGLVLLYALSGLVVSAVPAGGGSTDGKQLALSACWSLVGLALLVAGLRRDVRGIRLGGIALLSLTIAKVFLYDLASLGSLTRVGSFIALGVLLLAAAFAYQRQIARDGSES